MELLRSEADASLEEISFDEVGLLEGIPLEKRRSVLRCLHARVSHFEAGSSFSGRNSSTTPMRYMLQGTANAVRCDIYGNLSILETYKAGSILATAITGASLSENGIDVVAVDDCVTLDFQLTAEVDGCECCIKHVNRVRGNMICSLDEANANLIKRLNLLACRTTREKVIAYLAGLASTQKSDSFTIPMNRQELADYLYVDRSALSRELSRMEKEGLIVFERNHFQLLPTIKKLLVA